jgi:outer membrane protein insertion porin family
MESPMTKRCLVLNSLLAVLVVVLVKQVTIRAIDGNIAVQVDFEGNQVFTTDQLRIAMTSDAIGSQPRSGPPLGRELEKGLERLREFLAAHGYVNPRIGQPQVEDNGSGVIVKVPIEEGPLYRLGEVSITGASVFSEQQIIQALDMKQGDPFSGEAIRTWFERVKHLYADQGYINWTPIPRITDPSSESPEGIVDLALDMEEDSRFFVRRIEFTGDSLTDEQLLRHRLQIREGDIFIPKLLKASLEQINQLSLFEEVKLEQVNVELDTETGQIEISIPVRNRMRR